MYVKNETERKAEAIKYAKSIIEDLEREIHECDYVEDINGNLVYERGAYAEEKRALENEKYKWEKMLQLLTMEAPFSMLTW